MRREGSQGFVKNSKVIRKLKDTLLSFSYKTNEIKSLFFLIRPFFNPLYDPSVPLMIFNYLFYLNYCLLS